MKVAIKANRIGVGSFNFIKGFALRLIILWHMSLRYNVESIPPLYVLFFLMYPLMNGLNPLFFIVAGFTFKESDARTMLKKTFSGLMKPYITVAAIVTLVYPAIHFITYRQLPAAINAGLRYFLTFLLGIQTAGKIVFGYELYGCAVIWFLIAMFIATNVFNLVLKIKKEYLRFFVVILLFFSRFIFYKYDFTYYCIPQSLTAIIYFYWGYLIKKYQLLKNDKKTGRFFIILMCILVLYIIYGEPSLIYTSLFYGLMDYFDALCAGTAMMILGLWINNIDFVLVDKIKNVGMYTYWLICIHSVEMICIPWHILTNRMAEHQMLAFFIEISLKTVVFYVGYKVIKTIAVNKVKKKVLKAVQ